MVQRQHTQNPFFSLLTPAATLMRETEPFVGGYWMMLFHVLPHRVQQQEGGLLDPPWT